MSALSDEEFMAKGMRSSGLRLLEISKKRGVAQHIQIELGGIARDCMLAATVLERHIRCPKCGCTECGCGR